MARRHGKRRVAAQADRAADLAGKRVEPVRLAARARRSRPGAQRAACARPLERGAAQQRAGLERGAVGCQLEQRGAGARADDLDEAEAVDRGALERLGRISSTAAAAACRAALPPTGRQVDADRAADASRRIALRAAAAPATASSAGGKWPSTSISVIAGVSETRSSPPANRTMPLRASSIRSSQPAGSEHVARARETAALLRRSATAVPGAGPSPGQRPLPRLGAGDRLAGDLDVELRALGDTRGALRQQIFLACRPPRSPLRPLLDVVSRAARIVPAGTTPSSRIRASTISPSSTSDRAGLRRCRARSAIQAIG